MLERFNWTKERGQREGGRDGERARGRESERRKKTRIKD